MAVSTNPLDRATIRIIAGDTGDRLAAPRTNRALELAASLGEIAPSIGKLAETVAEDLKDKAEARAKRDAIKAAGARFADAVRDGRLEATQNPWYMSAYKKEAATIRAQHLLTQLQTESVTWASQSDAVAFEEDWRTKLGEIASQFEGEEAIEGFTPVAEQFTQQALQSNVAKNVQRIQDERRQNLSALAAQSLADASRAKGGRLSANEAFLALQPAREQWFSTGGTSEDWNALAIKAVTTAAYSTHNPGLIDLLKAPEIVNGESELGNDPIGQGAFTEDETPAPLAAAPQSQPEGSSAAVETSAPLRGYPLPGPITKTFSQHGGHGLDIDGKMGDPVRPRAGGRVASIGRSGPAGNHVIIDHGNGVTSSYSHLSRIDVKVGDTVGAGQVVGAVGNSGRVRSRTGDGSHLHYRIKVNGKDVDPTGYQFSASGGPAQAEQAAPAPPLQSLPESDRTEEETNPQALSRGPSLYDMAGVADQVESDRYRITQAVQDGQLGRLREIEAHRKVEGTKAASQLWATYGTKLLTGDFEVRTIVSQLAEAGYRPEVIAEALSQIRSATGDSAGLQQTRLQINSSEPTEAKRIMDLATRGRRDGYSEAYEEEVGREVLAGNISGEDGQSMVASALAKTQSEEAEQRAENRVAAAERKASGAVTSFDSLGTRAKSLAALGVQTTARLGRTITDDEQKLLEDQVRIAMLAHIEGHPGDWDGAYQAGRTRVSIYIQNVRNRKTRTGDANERPRRKPQAAPSGGNPRR